MRISSKGRYGLASMIYLAGNYDPNGCITLISISEQLGISKIYLEQIFALLKRSELVDAAKGSLGGYRLASHPERITAGEVLRALEPGLFDKTESSVSAGDIERSMQILLWDRLDEEITGMLDSITLGRLARVKKPRADDSTFLD